MNFFVDVFYKISQSRVTTFSLKKFRQVHVELFVSYHMYYYLWNILLLIIILIISNIVLSMSADASFFKTISAKHAGVPNVQPVKDLGKWIGPEFPIIKNVSIYDYQPDGREIPPTKSLNPKAHSIDPKIIFTEEYLEKDYIKQYNDNIDMRWVLIDTLKGQLGVDPGTNKEFYAFKAYILKAPNKEIASDVYKGYLKAGTNFTVKNQNSVISNLDPKQARWELIELKELVYIPKEDMYNSTINMLCYRTVGEADVFNRINGTNNNGEEFFDLGVRLFSPVGINGHVSKNTVVMMNKIFDMSTMQIITAYPYKESFFIMRIIAHDSLSIVTPGYISPPIYQVFEHWATKFNKFDDKK